MIYTPPKANCVIAMDIYDTFIQESKSQKMWHVYKACKIQQNKINPELE